MSRDFTYLTTANPVHSAFLKHLLPLPAEKVAAAPRRPSPVPVEERVLLRAFSDELEKNANPFLGAMWQAAKAGLPYAILGELGYEGVNRLVYPDAHKRSPLELAGDIGMTSLLHAPISAGLNSLGNVAKTAPLGSWSRWLAEKGHGPLSFVEGFLNPKTQVAWRTGSPLIEKAFGVEKSNPAKGLGDPGSPGDMRSSGTNTGTSGNSSMSPSYLQLRQMDPRVVSSRYMT